jgi:DNA-binding response OmpR family regulator
MGYTPAFNTSDALEGAGNGRLVSLSSVDRLRATRAMLRFGGLEMDPVSGVVHWRGKTVALSSEEREVLSVLMRRAGQIVSRERLVASLGVAGDAVDQRMESLKMRLMATGAVALPRKCDGLGYVLWRA